MESCSPSNKIDQTTRFSPTFPNSPGKTNAFDVDSQNWLTKDWVDSIHRINPRLRLPGRCGGDFSNEHLGSGAPRWIGELARFDDFFWKKLRRNSMRGNFFARTHLVCWNKIIKINTFNGKPMKCHKLYQKFSFQTSKKNHEIL